MALLCPRDLAFGTYPCKVTRFCGGLDRDRSFAKDVAISKEKGDDTPVCLISLSLS